MMKRSDFLRLAASAAVLSSSAVATSASGGGLEQEQPAPAVPPVKAASGIKRGVSLYSYQVSYFMGQMTVEDCLAEVSSIGAYGIELVSDSMIPNYPNPPDQWVKQWQGWMEQYHLVPFQYTQSQDTMLWRDRALTEEQGAERIRRDITCANRLGFTQMRVLGWVPTSVVLKCLPFAEKNNISMNFEIHGWVRLDGKLVNRWVELFESTKSSHLGLNPDFLSRAE